MFRQNLCFIRNGTKFWIISEIRFISIELGNYLKKLKVTSRLVDCFETVLDGRARTEYAK